MFVFSPAIFTHYLENEPVMQRILLELEEHG